jgi:hypothetical protein
MKNIFTLFAAMTIGFISLSQTPANMMNATSFPKPIADSAFKGNEFCGAGTAYIKGMNDARTTLASGGTIPPNSTYRYVLQSSWTGPIVHCGSFNIYYEDDVTAPAGFAAPGALGLQRKATLCAVLNYVSSIIDFHGATIDLFVNQSFSFPAHPYTATTGTLAFAGPEYPSGFTGVSGIYNGYAYDHINSLTGTDPDPATYDMDLTVNFHQYYNSLFSSFYPVNYYDDYTSRPTGNCSFDLYSVLLHEITHGLGFISFVSEDPSTHNAINGNSGVLYSNAFSKFDQQFLYKGNILTGPFIKLVDATPQINPLINTFTNPLRSNDIWLKGNVAPDPLNQPIYSGNSYGYPPSSPSLISHMDFDFWSFAGMSQFAPGYQPRYVMGPYFNENELRTEWTIPEMRILLALGYHLNPIFASASTLNPPTDLNSAILISNSPAFRSNPATLITDSNLPVNFSEIPPIDFVVTNNNSLSSPTATQFPIIISAIPNIADNNAGDQISIMPGSLFGIRGVSSGGDNHNLLTEVYTGTSLTKLIYTPVAGYRGIAQFGFYLWDGHEKGAFKTITMDVQQGSYTPIIGDELAINGSFEDGTEVRQYVVNTNLPYTTYLPNEEGSYFAGSHFSGGHPYSLISNAWGPIGAGQIIKSSYTYCGASATPAIFPPFGTRTNASNGGSSNPLPLTTIPNNERYAEFLYGNILLGSPYYINLADILHTNQFYSVEFDIAFSDGSPSFAMPGDNFTVQLQAIGNPVPSIYTPPVYQTINIPGVIANINHASTDMFWQHMIYTFQYCPTNISNIISIISSTPRTEIDNFSIKQMTVPPAFSSVTASTTTPLPVCSGAPVNLVATPDHSSCAITYIWQPVEFQEKSGRKLFSTMPHVLG